MKKSEILLKRFDLVLRQVFFTFLLKRFDLVLLKRIFQNFIKNVTRNKITGHPAKIVFAKKTPFFN